MKPEFKTTPIGLIVSWRENPLETRIDIDFPTRELLYWKIVQFYQEEAIHSAIYNLSEQNEKLLKRLCKGTGEKYSLSIQVEKAVKVLKSALFDEEDKSNKYETLTELYVKALRGTHEGDCTCVPMSCTKCHAEQLIGYDTTPGMDKYMGSMIAGAFLRGGMINSALECLNRSREAKNGKERDICTETIEWLEGYSKHLDRERH